MKNMLLQPSEVSRESLLWILEKAMFDVEPLHDVDEDTIICTESGWNFMIRVDHDKELVTFHCPLHIRSEASLKRKLVFVNAMSKKFILANVVLLDDDTMFVEYQFLYDSGITVRFFLNCFKRFVEISQSIGQESHERRLAIKKREKDSDPFRLGHEYDEEPEDEERVDMDTLMQQLFEEPRDS